MSAVTITVLDAAGKPQQFTAEPDLAALIGGGK